jgi:hypothetical protein
MSIMLVCCDGATGHDQIDYKSIASASQYNSIIDAEEDMIVQSGSSTMIERAAQLAQAAQCNNNADLNDLSNYCIGSDQITSSSDLVYSGGIDVDQHIISSALGQSDSSRSEDEYYNYHPGTARPPLVMPAASSASERIWPVRFLISELSQAI